MQAQNRDAQRRRLILAYVVAIILPFVVTILRRPFQGDETDPTPLGYFFIPVAVAAVLGGFFPALLAGVLSYTLADFYFLPPYGQFFGFDQRRQAQVVTAITLWTIFALMGEWKRYSSARELHTQEKLLEAEAQMRADYDRTLNSLVTIDNNFVIQRTNRVFSELANIDQAALVGMRLLDLEPFKSNSTSRAALLELAANGEEGSADIPGPEPGTWYFLRVYHDPAGALVVLREITERKVLEERNRELLENEQRLRILAEHASKANEEFLLMLSHELRTPLSTILGWTELLLASPDVTERTKRGLEQIQRSGSDQAKLVEELLDKSRIRAGRIELDRGYIDMGALVESGVSALMPTADEHGVMLTYSVPEEKTMLFADPLRLQQVLNNLLTNALKYTDRGGAVHVALTATAATVVLKVTDNGDGIEKTFLPHIFDRFRQADQSITRRHGGVGLGLTLVRAFVKLHGGSVTAASEGLGRGSEFTVILPRDAHVQKPLPERGKATASVDLAGLKIMVVEDDEPMREVIAHMLLESGALVEAVPSAAEALNRLSDHQPDVLISDIGMPDLDGYTFIRRVRESTNAVLAKLPAIALTAYASASDKSEALRSGYQVFLPKPVKALELTAAVSGLLRK